MENEQKKNELGNIYGSRISKNGNWLNLLIITNINGESVYITCPVRLRGTIDERKPFAGVDEGGRASVYNVPVYEDKKPEAKQEEKPFTGDIPF